MAHTTLLIDAHCVMCHGLANFLNKRITSDTVLEIHGIQSEEGQALIADFPPRLQAIDSVYVIRNGRVYVRSSASIRLLLTMRWYYAMWFPLAWLIPLPLRDAGYWFVSKIRHRFGRREP